MFSAQFIRWIIFYQLWLVSHAFLLSISFPLPQTFVSSLSLFTVLRKTLVFLFAFARRKIMWLIHIWQYIDVVRHEDYDYFDTFFLFFFETENELINWNSLGKQFITTTTINNIYLFASLPMPASLCLTLSLCPLVVQLFFFILFLSWYVLRFECSASFAHCIIIFIIYVGFVRLHRVYCVCSTNSPINNND